MSRVSNRSSHEALADPAVVRQLWLEFSQLDDTLERHVIDTGAQTPEDTADVVINRWSR